MRSFLNFFSILSLVSMYTFLKVFITDRSYIIVNYIFCTGTQLILEGQAVRH